MCGLECDMLFDFRRIQVECSSCLGCWSYHVIHERCRCILSQRRCRLPRRSHPYILTIDWKNLIVGFDVSWFSQGHSSRRVLRDHLVNNSHGITIVWLQHRVRRINLLQNRWWTSSHSIYEITDNGNSVSNRFRRSQKASTGTWSIARWSLDLYNSPVESSI